MAVSINQKKMKNLFGKKDFEKQALGYLDSLYFTALKLTGHQEEAEDLVQEAYCKAFSQFRQLRDLRKCKQWLYKIMINLWKNWKTKTSRQVLTENYEFWEDSISQYATDNPQLQLKNPEADLIHKELWEAVESALTHLNPDYRMAVILSDIEGFSYKEISVLMECSIGTVMSRLARAREHLGRLLAKYKERM